MNLNHHAGLLAFVEHGAEDFDFLRRRPGNRRQEHLAGELDAHRGKRTNLGARHLGRVFRKQADPP